MVPGGVYERGGGPQWYQGELMRERGDHSGTRGKFMRERGGPQWYQGKVE